MKYSEFSWSFPELSGPFDAQLELNHILECVTRLKPPIAYDPWHLKIMTQAFCYLYRECLCNCNWNQNKKIRKIWSKELLVSLFIG